MSFYATFRLSAIQACLKSTGGLVLALQISPTIATFISKNNDSNIKLKNLVFTLRNYEIFPIPWTLFF